jgi:hypothetical protein
MVMVAFNTIATSAQMVANPLALPAPGNFAVTLTSELFNTNMRAINGIILPDNTTSLSTMVFTDYFKVAPLSRRILRILHRELRNNRTSKSISHSDFLAMSSYTMLSNISCDLSKRCFKSCSPCDKTTFRSHFLKYLSFISCSLRVFPCLGKSSRECRSFVDACSQTDLNFEMYCAILTKISSTLSIKITDVRAVICSFFEVVVGYNPYCYYGPNTCKLYGLSEKDSRCVSGVCGVEEVIATECEVVEEEAVNESESIAGQSKSSESFISKYKWTITVTVAVVVIVCVSAYAYIM